MKSNSKFLFPTHSFDTLVDLRSFEGANNRLPFRAIEPGSVSAYANTVVRLVLFLRRHNAAPLPGVPAISADIADALAHLPHVPTATNVRDLLRSVFTPSHPPAQRQDELLTWFVRLVAHSSASSFNIGVANHTLVHLVYCARYGIKEKKRNQKMKQKKTHQPKKNQMCTKKKLSFLVNLRFCLFKKKCSHTQSGCCVAVAAVKRALGQP